jgi:hypothetical protein
MTTVEQDIDAVTAELAEIVARCKLLVPKAQGVCERIMRESPHRAGEILPIMEGLAVSMAKLCGQVQ